MLAHKSVYNVLALVNYPLTEADLYVECKHLLLHLPKYNMYIEKPIIMIVTFVHSCPYL